MPHALFNARAGSDADSYTAIYLGYAHLLPCLVLSQTAANKCTVGPLLRRGALSLPQVMRLRLHLRAHTLIFIYFDGEIHKFRRNVGTNLFRRTNLRKEWAGQLALTASRKNMSDHPVIVCFPL